MSFLPPSQLRKIGAAQDQAQAAHCCQPLPKDLVHDGKSLTLVYRTHSKGGAVVMLQNSLPGRADGHRYLVFQIDIVGGRETLGAVMLGDSFTLTNAIDIATRPIDRHNQIDRGNHED
jgi:hypothetical protein